MMADIESPIGITLDTLQQEVFSALVRLDEMQASQLNMLSAGRLESLILWQEERAELLGRLMKCFDKYTGGNNFPLDGEVVSRLREKVGIALEKEKMLISAAATQKGAVKKRLTAMQKGKKALHGYKLSQGMVSPPRYLQNRT